MIKKQTYFASILSWDIYSLHTSTVSAPNVPITICNKMLVCTDMAADRSVVGEHMYELYLKIALALNFHTQDATLSDEITMVG